MLRQGTKLSLIILCLIGLPLVGIFLAGQPVRRYLEFPPVTQFVEHAPFSWGVFSGLFLFLGAVFLVFLTMSLQAKKPKRVYLVQTKAWPWWGWLGFGIVVVAWTLAWTRFSWFETFQPYTFTPVWIGYIIVINATTFVRTGHCLMTHRLGYFLSLFPLSALFWWFFEYLNRFVQNWYYVGVVDLSPIEYFAHATVSFSTVLPAVLGTIECLESFPWLDGLFRDLPSLTIRCQTLASWLVLLLAGGGLLGIGVWPDYLFPLVWISPLLIITSMQALFGETTIFSATREGDWRPVWFPALSGFICGFFWELWNSQSLAHWEYTVPFVHDFQIFAMPLLGYAGYLPFGLECVVVAGLLPGLEKKGGAGPSER